MVTVTDDGSPSKAGSVEFAWEVIEVNRPPTVDPVSVVALVGTPLSIELNADDPDADALTYELAEEPTAGSLEGEGPEFVYATPGGAAEDSFSVVVSDGDLEARAVVSIRIRAGNSPPTADPDSYDLVQGESLVVDAPGVMSNDSDLDAEALVAGKFRRRRTASWSLGRMGRSPIPPSRSFLVVTSSCTRLWSLWRDRHRNRRSQRCRRRSGASARDR